MEKITKRFGGTVALDGTDLSAAGGEVHALLGENGSGKSTLMKILAGIHKADSGAVILDDKPIRIHGTHGATEAGIAIVHQELNLVPALSAAENLFIGQELRTRFGLMNHRAVLQRATELFQRLNIAVDPHVPVELLPVGRRQMVEIARALTRKARILILDEPTSALSESEVEILFRIIRQLRREGVGIIYISHKMAEVFALADRYTVLRDGRTVLTGEMRGTTEGQIVQAMVGRQLGDYYPERVEAVSDEPMLLKVSNLTRPRTGARKIVNDVSFEMRRGEIVGIAGLVGAGRTELLESIFGAAGHDWSGMIELHGTPIHATSPAQAIRRGIALVTEDRGGLGLFFRQSVLSNATIAQLPRLCRSGIISSRRETSALAAQSDTMRIRRASDQIPVDFLSGGNQQKVILARWLMTGPKLLLLDEPTRGIDVGTKAEIYRVLRALADEGIGILFVSSEMPEVLGLADRILVLCGGKITAEFAARDATEQAILAAAMPTAAVS